MRWKIDRIKKEHSISELKNILHDHKIAIDISDDACDYLDSIYLPSKYSLGSALPDFEPNADLCQKGVEIAQSIFDKTAGLLGDWQNASILSFIISQES